MGFGLLLIGYIFAFTAKIGLGPYHFAGMALGGFLTYLGLSELKKYSPVFIYAQIVNVALILCSFFKTLIWANDSFALSLSLLNDNVALGYQFVEFCVTLLFDLTLLYGIADLARRVEHDEIKGKAYRNMIFVGVYYVYQIVMFFPIANDILMSFLPILQLIYSAINALLIFKCYAMICPEGDEEMPRKPSRFAFINKIRAEREAREQKAIEETKQYYENRNKNKKKKKKK